MTQLNIPLAERHSTPLWRNLSFHLMWSSTAASGFGDRMIELAALPMLGVAAEGAQASSITAAIYFWFFVPWLLITPIGGWLADTLPRKWVMFFCDEGRALILLAACLMIPAGMHAAEIPPTENWKVFLILAGVGSLAAVFGPTRNAMVPQIVTARQLNPANSMVLGIGVIASLIGYVIGGWLLEDYSLRTGVFIALLCYAITGFFWVFVKPNPHTGLDLDRNQSEWHRFICSARYIRKHSAVLRLVLLNAALWSMAMIVASAIAALCKHNYAITENYMWSFSLMSAMLGVGMLAASLFVTFFNIRRESDVIILTVLVLTAACMIALAVNHSFNVGLFLAVATGFCAGVAMIIISTLTQRITPNYILGRVGGVREQLSNIMAVLVNLVIWQLPALREVNPNLPEADPLLIFSLYPIAALLIGIAAYGFWTHLVSRPLPSRPANLLWRITRLYVLVWHRAQWVGRHHIPTTGAVILAANHTTGLDPLLMQSGCRRMVRWVMIGAYKFRILNPIWNIIRPITVNQNGKDLSSLRQMLAALKEGDIVGIYPEGGLQREKRELQPFAAGVGMLAARSEATIVPVWIDGTPKVHNMLRHFLRPSSSLVVYGEPYKADTSKSNQEIADDLRARMLALAAGIDRARAERAV